MFKRRRGGAAATAQPRCHRPPWPAPLPGRECRAGSAAHPALGAPQPRLRPAWPFLCRGSALCREGLRFASCPHLRVRALFFPAMFPLILVAVITLQACLNVPVLCHGGGCGQDQAPAKLLNKQPCVEDFVRFDFS